MRSIDNMTPQEIETLALKGMLADNKAKPVLSAMLDASESFADNKAQPKDGWCLTTWPDGHQCEKRYVNGQYTGEFRNVRDPAPNKAQPQHSPLATVQQWTDQARNAIRQGQNLNEFILHCHPGNRNEARKAYKRLSIEHVRAQADKLAADLKLAIQVIKECGGYSHTVDELTETLKAYESEAQ